MNCLLLQMKGDSKRIYLGKVPNDYILPEQTSQGYFTFGRASFPDDDIDYLIITCHNTQEVFVHDTGRTFKLNS